MSINYLSWKCFTLLLHNCNINILNNAKIYVYLLKTLGFQILLGCKSLLFVGHFGHYVLIKSI